MAGDCRAASGENIKVFLRIKPLPDESLRSAIRQSPDSDNSVVLSGVKPEIFIFDRVFGQNTSQEAVFKSIGVECTESCLLGYNTTIFAYGQTGSGKTFTMQGATDRASADAIGLIPRIFNHLFYTIGEREKQAAGSLVVKCKCSYVEIYNECIYDLLSTATAVCSIRDDPERGVVVDGAILEEVSCASEALSLFTRGTKNRTVAETVMNRESSRGHSIFTIHLRSTKTGSSTVVRESRFNLVDLAGSERQSQTATAGARLKEAGSINKSLMSLGLVISALLETGGSIRNRHVPYRDSKLTFLLRDSLGGNTKTVIIANINPIFTCSGESSSTLRFAQRAKMIVNDAKINKNVLISVAELQTEVATLRAQLEKSENQVLTFDAPPFLERIERLVFENESLAKQAKLLSDSLSAKESELLGERMKLKLRETSYSTVNRLLREECKDHAISHRLQQLEAEIQHLRESMSHNPEVVALTGKNLYLEEKIACLEKNAIDFGYVQSLESRLSSLATCSSSPEPAWELRAIGAERKLSLQSDNLAALLVEKTFLEQAHQEQSQFLLQCEKSCEVWRERYSSFVDMLLSAKSFIVHSVIQPELDSINFKFLEVSHRLSQLGEKLAEEKASNSALRCEIHRKNQLIQSLQAASVSAAESFQRQMSDMEGKFDSTSEAHRQAKQQILKQIESQENIFAQKEGLISELQGRLEEMSESCKNSRIVLADALISHKTFKEHSQEELSKVRKSYADSLTELENARNSLTDAKTKLSECYRQGVLDRNRIDSLVLDLKQLHGKIHAIESDSLHSRLQTMEEECKSLKKTIAQQVIEINELRIESENFIQHQNKKQKVQYHQEIKNENNKLKELLRRYQDRNELLEIQLKEAR